MPGEQSSSFARGKKIGWILSAKRNFRARGPVEERGQIAVHEFSVVGGVRWPLMQETVSIMSGQVERRTTCKRGQPRHRFLALAMTAVEIFEASRQSVFLKIMAQLYRMSAGWKVGPLFGHAAAEQFQGLMTVVIRGGAGPDPLHAERGFAPTFGATAVL